MQKINYRKHCFLFLILSALALTATILLVVVVDPFFHYHKPLDGPYYLIENKISQNPGIAKHFEYDSAIVGSSMTVNFDTELFHEKMGLNTIKLSYDGAYPKDIDNIMQFVKESSNELSTVFLGIDIFTYKAEPGITAYELPKYLYDDCILNDVSYLLNKEVVLEYVLRPQIEGEGTPIREMYWTWPLLSYGKSAVAQSYKPPAEFCEQLPSDYYAQNITDSLERYILPHIESMPETEFVVFFPPYSILYWYNRYADGSLNAELQGIEQITETLLSYPNVKIFYFQDQFDYITNLDNYTDYTHYYRDMNDYMTECFADDTCQLTAKNYRDVLNHMHAWLQECDFESYVP